MYLILSVKKKKNHTICPGSSDPFYISLYKLGHCFLDTQYVNIKNHSFPVPDYGRAKRDIEHIEYVASTQPTAATPPATPSPTSSSTAPPSPNPPLLYNTGARIFLRGALLNVQTTVSAISRQLVRIVCVTFFSNFK